VSDQLSVDRYEHRRILTYRGASMSSDQQELFAGDLALWDAWGSRGRRFKSGHPDQESPGQRGSGVEPLFDLREPHRDTPGVPGRDWMRRFRLPARAVSQARVTQSGDMSRIRRRGDQAPYARSEDLPHRRDSRGQLPSHDTG
jgi:hypothetical protein